MSNYNANTIERTTREVLERMGVVSPLISYSQARKVYGSWFVELVKLGEIRPVMVGRGANGTQHYQVSDILQKIDEAKRQAYADYVING